MAGTKFHARATLAAMFQSCIISSQDLTATAAKIKVNRVELEAHQNATAKVNKELADEAIRDAAIVEQKREASVKESQQLFLFQQHQFKSQQHQRLQNQQQIQQHAQQRSPGIGGQHAVALKSRPAINTPQERAALSYLNEVKFEFRETPGVYDKFVDIIKEFKSAQTDPVIVIARVAAFFEGHTRLIVGLNAFFPPGFQIKADSGSGQLKVIITENRGDGTTTTREQLVGRANPGPATIAPHVQLKPRTFPPPQPQQPQLQPGNILQTPHANSSNDPCNTKSSIDVGGDTDRGSRPRSQPQPQLALHSSFPAGDDDGAGSGSASAPTAATAAFAAAAAAAAPAAAHAPAPAPALAAAPALALAPAAAQVVPESPAPIRRYLTEIYLGRAAEVVDTDARALHKERFDSDADLFDLYVHMDVKDFTAMLKNEMKVSIIGCAMICKDFKKRHSAEQSAACVEKE